MKVSTRHAMPRTRRESYEDPLRIAMLTNDAKMTVANLKARTPFILGTSRGSDVVLENFYRPVRETHLDVLHARTLS